MSSHRTDILISTDYSSILGAILFAEYIKDASEEDLELEERISRLDPLHDKLQRLYTSGTTWLPKGVKYGYNQSLHI